MFKKTLVVVAAVATITLSGSVFSEDVGLYCTAKLCLMSPTRPSECNKAIKKYTKEALKGRGLKFLNKCKDGDDGTVSSFVMNCSREKLLRSLNNRRTAISEMGSHIETPQTTIGRCTALNKKMAERAKERMNRIAKEYGLDPASFNNIEVSYEFLPLRVSHWVVVDDESFFRKTYRLVHKWGYSDDLPEGTLTYNPNTGERFDPPPCSGLCLQPVTSY